jgi:hypothetical protein
MPFFNRRKEMPDLQKRSGNPYKQVGPSQILPPFQSYSAFLQVHGQVRERDPDIGILESYKDPLSKLFIQ